MRLPVVPLPERDSIFGDTYDGVPTPNTIIEHGYPTRFHGPVLTTPQPGYVYKGRPYAKASFMGYTTYPGYHRGPFGAAAPSSGTPYVITAADCEKGCAEGLSVEYTPGTQEYQELLSYCIGQCMITASQPEVARQMPVVVEPTTAPPAPAPGPTPGPTPAPSVAVDEPKKGLAAWWAARTDLEKTVIIAGGVVATAVAVTKLGKKV